MDETLGKILEYYRRFDTQKDQSALVSLLREVQQENCGAIPTSLLPQLAEALEVRESYLLAVIRRIPSLRLSDSHVLELCAGPNCGKHTHLAALAETLCTDKNVRLKFVPCMRLCGKGPNLKWDGTLYHKADEALIRQLLEKL